MAERALRGSRLGAQSYETDLGVEMAPRQSVTYDCPRDHRFTIPFSLEADVPDVWECTVCGAEALRVDGTRPEPKNGKPARTTGTCSSSAAASRTSRSCSPSVSSCCGPPPRPRLLPAGALGRAPDRRHRFVRPDRRSPTAPHPVPVAPLPPGGAAGTLCVRAVCAVRAVGARTARPVRVLPDHLAGHDPAPWAP